MTLYSDTMRMLSLERLRHLHDLIEKEMLPRWRAMAQVWRGNNRTAPIYALRVVKRNVVYSIFWEHMVFYTKPGTNRRQGRRSGTLARGTSWQYERKVFKHADDSQWEHIQSIEKEAGPLRREMAEIERVLEILRVFERDKPW